MCIRQKQIVINSHLNKQINNNIDQMKSLKSALYKDSTRRKIIKEYTEIILSEEEFI